MKLVDTNVLVRFITRDVPDMAAQADIWIENAAPAELYVDDAVFEELTFVLSVHDGYQLPRDVVVRALLRLVSLPGIRTSPDALKAIECYGTYAKLDFVDCLLAVKGGMKHSNVLTFDKDLRRILA